MTNNDVQVEEMALACVDLCKKWRCWSESGCQSKRVPSGAHKGFRCRQKEHTSWFIEGINPLGLYSLTKHIQTEGGSADSYADWESVFHVHGAPLHGLTKHWPPEKGIAPTALPHPLIPRDSLQETRVLVSLAEGGQTSGRGDAVERWSSSINWIKLVDRLQNQLERMGARWSLIRL